MSTPSDLAVDSQRRADAYWFLASLFGHPLDRETLKRIAGVAADMPSEDVGIAAALHQAFVGEDDIDVLTERLAREHARLFLGLRRGYGPPPPYESLWREDRIMGDSTLAVAAAYSEVDFEDHGPWGPCDHLAYELRFMASLCNAESQALIAHQQDEAEWVQGRQTNFLREHLLAWVPAYCHRLAEQTMEPLYQALAQIAEDLLAEDAREAGIGFEEFATRNEPSSGDTPTTGVEL